MADEPVLATGIAQHGASRLPSVEVDGWGVLTIGMGLGNTRFTNGRKEAARTGTRSGSPRRTGRNRPSRPTRSNLDRLG